MYYSTDDLIAMEADLPRPYISEDDYLRIHTIIDLMKGTIVAVMDEGRAFSRDEFVKASELLCAPDEFTKYKSLLEDHQNKRGSGN